MTDERDFDRISRAWLDLMPSEAPDRTVAAVLQAVETTPQLRRPLADAVRRPISVNRYSFAALAAALAVVVGGVVLLRPSNVTNVGLPASSAPKPTLSPRPTAAQSAMLPMQIRGHWLGATRSLPGLDADAGTAVQIGQGSFVMTQSNHVDTALLAFSASVSPANLLEFNETTRGPCQSSDVGEYRWSVSTSDRELTISVDHDSCSARALAVSGTWWRDQCKFEGTSCLGPIDAGTYPTQYFNPRANTTATWRPFFGAMTYTVPSGWAHSVDWPSQVRLTPSEDFSLESRSGPYPDQKFDIFVFAEPAIAKQGGKCTGELASQGSRSVDELVSGLRAVRALSVGPETSLTIAGHPAKMVDVSLAPAYSGACPDAGAPSTEVFASTGIDKFTVDISASERDRLILVDLGGDIVVGIAIRSSDPARFDTLVAEAMPIVESFRFK